MSDQDEILKLLENQEELTPELLALIEEYQQLKEQETNEELELPFAIGNQCAITFAINDHLVLLPSIVLGYSNSKTVIRVLILTPVTEDTVPCSNYFNGTCDDEHCPHSHGYELPTEYVTSFDALGTTDAEALVKQLQYGKRVWCKAINADIWKLGNIIDQLHGPRWRVRLRDATKKRITVDIEHIMPFKSLLEEEYNDDEQEEWSESDRESVIVEEQTQDNQAFGGWQVHTTGFAAKMMKKMGYVEGKGLGVEGEGRVEPVQAYTGRRRNENSRPGLGHEEKKKSKKKPKKKKEQEVVEEEDDMFGLMNSLLGSDTRAPTTPVSKPKNITFKSGREANQAIAKLQSQVNKAETEYIRAAEAYRRNKGSPMEAQFRTKLKSTTNNLESLKKELSQLQRHVKQAKEKKDMYTF